jgi:hypothetical protein
VRLPSGTGEQGIDAGLGSRRINLATTLSQKAFSS